MRNSVILLQAFLALTAAAVYGAERTWNGGGSDAAWNTAANWGGTSPVADDALFFGGTSQLITTNDIAAGTSFAGITFNIASGAFTLRGNGIILSGNLVNNDDSVQSLSLPVTLDATRTFNAASGDLVVDSVISGVGGLTKTGTKRVTLQGANSYEGETVVEAGGRLLIRHNDALGSPLAGTTIQTGTGIEIHDGITVAEPITLVNQNSGSMTFISGSNTYSGMITIAGGQARIQNMSPFAHITGGITSDTSTVILDSGNAAGTPVMSITGKPILAGTQKCFVHGSRTTRFGVTGNVFNILEVAGGSLLLDQPQLWLPTLRLEVGVSYSLSSHIDLRGNDQTIGTLTGAIHTNGIRTITSSTGPATLTVKQSANSEYNSNFAGGLSLVKLGTGTLNVTGKNCQQTGRTVIGGGKLGILAETTLGVNPGSFAADHLVISNSATLLALSPCVLDDPGRGITLGAGSGTFESSAAADILIATPVTGSGGLVKAGAGSLTLTGVNSYAGLTTVNAGILQVAQKVSLYNGAPLSADLFTVNSGAALALHVGGAGAFTSSDVSDITALGTAATGFKPGAWLALNPEQAPDGVYEVSDALGNPAGGHSLSLQKTGAGTLALSAPNAYSGPTKISQGLLSIPSIANGGVLSPLGQSSAHRDNLVFDGGVLQYTGASARTDRGFKSAVATNALAFEVTRADTILTFDSIANALLSSASTVIRKTGPGTLAFGKLYPAGGHGNYPVSAIHLLEGKLRSDIAGNTVQQNLYCAAINGPALLLGDGVELMLQTPLERNNDRLVRYIGTQTCARITSSSMTLCGPDTLPANTHTFDINDGADEIDLLITATLDVYPGATAISDVIKDGAGTLKLASNNNRWRGVTAIRNGGLLVGGNVTSGSAGPLGSSTNEVRLGDALTRPADNPTLLFEGTAASNFTFNRKIVTHATGGTATIGSISNNNVTFSGLIAVSNQLQITSLSTDGKTVSISGAISGPGGIAKIGSGTVLLTSANSYTGTTTVAAGTLRLGAAERIADASALRLTGGTFETGGFSQTMSTLDVDGDAVIDFGSGSCVLTFDASESHSWEGTLTLLNWNGSAAGGGTDQLFVGTAAGGLTQLQLAKIITPTGKIARQLSTGEVVLMPHGTVLIVR